YSANVDLASECTYCEWCINNGCVALTDIYKINEKVISCNCDCQKDHPYIQIYVCNEHYKTGKHTHNGVMMSCCMKPCKKCGTVTNTDYCSKCSALFRICMTCGVEKIE